DTLLYLFCHHISLVHSIFFHYTATTEIYPLSLHDALPISLCCRPTERPKTPCVIELCHSQITCPSTTSAWGVLPAYGPGSPVARSEEHTSELQSLTNLVCRLLLEKKKNTHTSYRQPTLQRI